MMNQIVLIFVLLLGVIQCQAEKQKYAVNPKIIGGTPATANELPYQVSIRYRPPGNLGGYSHRCGGALIRASHALTAAQCVHDTNNKVIERSTLQVAAGGINLNGLSETINAIHVAYYSSYRNGDNKNHDIAIIKVEKPFTLNMAIRLIPYRRVPTDSFETCVISGWGTTTSGGNMTSSNLLKAEVTTVNYDVCKKAYSSALTSNMICASATGRDACMGDGGGALVCGGEVAGIISFGRGCATPGYPGVYTEVARYVSWIDSNSGATKLQNIMIFSLAFLLFKMYIDYSN